MKVFSVCTAVLAAGVIATLGGCNTAGSDWNKAVAQNTEASYQSFLSAHPDDSHASDAKVRLSALQDDQAWSATLLAGSPDRYQRYLHEWPAGKHDQEASDAIAAAESKDWTAAQADGSMSAMQGFLQKYPDGAHAAQAKTKLAGLTAFRAQLASEPTEIRAEHKLAQLKRRFGEKVQDLSVIPPSTEGGKYSIASMGMSQTQAQQTCESVKAAHQPCEVISGSTAS